MPRLTPAERVEKLARQYGSDEKLARAIAEKTGGRRPTYQNVIRWRQGRGGISEDYAAALAELAGTEPEAFRPQALTPQFRSMAQKVDALGAEVKKIRGEVAALRKLVEKTGTEAS